MCMWTQNPEDPGRQIYGAMLEMEIKFELEDSDLDCVFTPDFRVQANTSDIKSVQWRLPSTGTPINVGILCEELPTEISTDTPIFSGPDV